MSSYNCLFHAVTKALGRGGHTNLRRGVSALFTNGSTLLHALQRLPTERYEKHYGGSQGDFPIVDSRSGYKEGSSVRLHIHVGYVGFVLETRPPSTRCSTL